MNKPRKKSATLTYHVVIKGADRQLLFEESDDYKKYLEIIKKYKKKFGFELFAYCLMPNHVHLLIRHPKDSSLENIFRCINTSYSVWFNSKYNRAGYLQNGRYHSEPIEDDQYLMTVLRYIHFNPTKAGIETHPGSSYSWNSYYDYQKKIAGSREKTLTDTSLVLGIMGNPEYFIALHDKIPHEACMDIDQFSKRLPDDVAREIIFQVSKCCSTTEFQKLSISNRNQFIKVIHEKGVSIRQINRLAGISKGIIQKVI